MLTRHWNYWFFGQSTPLITSLHQYLNLICYEGARVGPQLNTFNRGMLVKNWIEKHMKGIHTVLNIIKIIYNCPRNVRNILYRSTNKSLKADFHSVQNVARSTFSERFLLNYKQSSETNLISCA